MDELTPEQIEEQEERAQIEAEVFGGEEKPLEEPEAKIEIEEEVAPKEEEKLSPTMQALVDNLATQSAQYAKDTQRLRKAEGNIGSLKADLQAAKAALQTVNNQPTHEEIAQATATKKEWEELKKEFPEWGKGVDKRFTETDNKLTATEQRFEAAIKHLQGTQEIFQQQVLTEADRLYNKRVEEENKVEMATLQHYYPNYLDISQSPEFQTWIGSQPAHDQIRYQSNSAKDAVYLLHKFSTEEQTPTIQDQRQQRLSAATTVTKRGPTPRSVSEADMTPAQLREHIGKTVFSK